MRLSGQFQGFFFCGKIWRARKAPKCKTSDFHPQQDDLSVIDEIIHTYQNHHNVKQIKDVIAKSNTPKPIYFSLEPTNPVEVQKRLQNIDATKATGFDKIPPKLVKLSAEVLSTALSIAINNSLKYGVFPMMPKLNQLFHLTKVIQTKMESPMSG